MMQADYPCRDCDFRRVGCHGKDASGQWVCRAWGAAQEVQQRLAQEKADAMQAGNYVLDKRERLRKRKKSGSGKRR